MPGELVEGSTVGRVFRYWHRTHPHAERINQRTYDFRDIREAYHQADIAVIPTVFSEGTSYACLEAMSCGLPVIASNVGGLNDLIQDGFNGLLVPPGEQELTAALVRLVQDRGRARTTGNLCERLHCRMILPGGGAGGARCWNLFWQRQD
ncbi:glycosyltransferase family 4 protein [Paenibacillus amylolyticus]|nr:glycosyltransferase family 4 protein [Paenibacillus amylolyticus]